MAARIWKPRCGKRDVEARIWESGCGSQDVEARILKPISGSEDDEQIFSFIEKVRLGRKLMILVDVL